MRVRHSLSLFVCVFTFLACAGSAGASINFQYPQATTTLALAPAYTASADFNNDGNLDIIITDNYLSNDVEVLLGDGKGGFTPLPPIYSVDNPLEVFTADFNGDGKIDLAVMGKIGGSFRPEILLGNGDGTFQSPSGTIGDSVGLVVGDFNGDGIPDLASSDSFGGRPAQILLGNGDGSFRPGGIALVSGQLVAADFNLDGNLDLADPYQLAFGNGDGTFRRPIEYGNFDNDRVATGDFNGDGIPDLAGAAFGTLLTTYQGNGDGTFRKGEITTNLFVNSMTCGDLNGDGISDLITIESQNLSVYLGTLNGGIGTPTSSFVPSIAAVTLGHFNGDEKLDIVTVGAGTSMPVNQVRTLLGNGAGGFDTPPAYPGPYGSQLLNIVTGDFNKDGIPDVAMSPGGISGVEVLLGAKGGFKTSTVYPSLYSPVGLAIGDVNNDGNLDLLTAESASDQYSLLLGNGDGTFQHPRNMRIQSAENELLLADFNHDGNLDLVSAVGTAYLSLGNGDGTFHRYLTIAHDVLGFAAGDLNGDGNLDLVFSGSQTLEVYLGNGDGTFTLVQKVSQVSQASWLTLADLNADGKLDLVAPNDEGVMVALGLGNGNFSDPKQYGAGFQAFQAQVADFDGDAKADIAVVGSVAGAQYALWVFPGNGDGTFQRGKSFPVVDPSFVLAIADFNGDGKPDIASLATSQLLLLKNTSH